VSQQYTSCRAVIIKDRKIILIHRYNQGQEYWVFPGGHIEPGETVSQALRREIAEELSLRVTSIGQARPYRHPDGTTEIFIYCQVSPGEPLLGGPEKAIQSAVDTYHPKWVDLEFALGLEKLYPTPVRDTLRQNYAHL